MDIKNSTNFKKTVVLLAKKLKDYQYAVRGTSSLVLQGIEMNVDDIDVVCDKETALIANKLFKDYLQNKISYRESDKFKSYFGEFKIEGVKVEVMGDWQIKDNKGKWSEPFNASNDVVTEVDLDGVEVRLTKVDTELRMYILMGRWSAYHKIKKQLRK